MRFRPPSRSNTQVSEKPVARNSPYPRICRTQKLVLAMLEVCRKAPRDNMVGVDERKLEDKCNLFKRSELLLVFVTEYFDAIETGNKLRKLRVAVVALVKIRESISHSIAEIS